MNLVVIYETAFNTVDAVLEYLRQNGYNAVALESPFSERPRVTDPSRHTLRDFISPQAYIAVPHEQETGARKALSGFRLSPRKRLAAMCETLLFQVLVASLVTLIVAILMIIDNPFEIFFPILYAVWLGAFIFVANLSRIDAMINRQRNLRL